MKIGPVHISILAIFILMSPNPGLMAFAGLVLFLVLRMMWREFEPKHLLVNMVLYWMVVAILLPYGALTQSSLLELSQFNSPTIVLAATLSIISLIPYVLGCYLPIRSLKLQGVEWLKLILERYDGRKMFLGYIFTSIGVFILTPVLLRISGGQMLMSLVYFKWVFLTVLIIHTSILPSNTKYVLILIGFEVLLSFSGFWANFKDYILVAIGAFFTLSRKFSWKGILALLFIGFVLFFVSSVWSFSKNRYRNYLTGGERTQAVVETDQFKNVTKLWEIVSEDFSAENFSTNFKKGSELLLYRVSYIEYFGLTLKQVPTFIPHENGKLLMDALEHIFKPRILFPDKKAIDDSEITSTYTGVQFTRAAQGTTFSLGCVPEFYIDFGPIYMFVPVFFIGLLLGLMYRFFLLKGYNIIWGMCYSAPFLNFAWSFPVPTAKFLGWSITYFVGIYFINRYLIKYLDNWLLKPEFKEQ